MRQMANDEGSPNDSMTKGIAERIGLLRALSFVISASSFFLRVSQHFLYGCVAGEDTAQAVLPQRYHSKLHRLLL